MSNETAVEVVKEVAVAGIFDTVKNTVVSTIEEHPVASAVVAAATVAAATYGAYRWLRK